VHIIQCRETTAKGTNLTMNGFNAINVGDGELWIQVTTVKVYLMNGTALHLIMVSVILVDLHYTCSIFFIDY
jgi:hypothetical protein